MPQELLKQFCSAIIESVLCISITVWFSSATKSDLRRLRRVVRTAERIIGTTLPTLQELYSSRESKKAGKITLDPSHPAHSLFELLPSGRRYRALSTRTIVDMHTHNCLHYILHFCYFVHCLFVYSFIICVLSLCCPSVALWSFCRYKFLVCVNIPVQ